MADSTGDAYIDDLLTHLQVLPSSVNPYFATVKWLIDKVSPPPYPDTYQKLIIAFACIFAFQTFLLTAATIILLMGEGNWIFRLTRDGLWQSNPRIAYSFLCAAFCGINTASLIRQALINVGKLDYHNRIALEGLRWTPLWLAGWLFVHACVGNIIMSRREMGDAAAIGTKQATASLLHGRGRSRWPIWTLNIVGAALPIAVIAAEGVAFSFANNSQNELIDGAQALGVQLAVAARTYQPTVFKPEDLSPFFNGIRGIESLHSDMVMWWRIGMGVLSASMIFILIFLSPFFFRHLALLKGLIGAPSFWRALMPDFVTRISTPSASGMNSGSRDDRWKYPHASGVPPISTPINVSLDSRNTIPMGRRDSEKQVKSDDAAYPPNLYQQPEAHYTPDIPRAQPCGATIPTVAFSHPNAQSTPKTTFRSRFWKTRSRGADLRGEYRRLLMSGLAVWLGEVLYLPLAIWATVTSLESPEFWQGEVWLANVSYLMTILAVNLFFIYIPAGRQLYQRLRPSPSTERPWQRNTGGSRPSVGDIRVETIVEVAR